MPLVHRRKRRRRATKAATARAARFKCQDCRRHFLERNRARHTDRCPKRKVRCPKCGRQHLARNHEQHLLEVCIVRHGRPCSDCRRVFYRESDYARHWWERHHKLLDSLPSNEWTQSGEITHPELVATGHAVQGGLPGSGR